MSMYRVVATTTLIALHISVICMTGCKPPDGPPTKNSNGSQPETPSEAKNSANFLLNGEPFGKLLWSNKILATRIKNIRGDEASKSPYGAEFNPQLIHLPVGYIPERSFSDNLKQIEVKFELVDQDESRARILDVYPETNYEESGWKVGGKIRASTKFTQESPTTEASVGGDIGVSFDYQPLSAKVVEAYSDTVAEFKLAEIGDEQPIGTKDYYLIVLVPKTISRLEAKVTVTVWFQGDSLIAKYYPESKLETGPHLVEINFVPEH